MKTYWADVSLTTLQVYDKFVAVLAADGFLPQDFTYEGHNGKAWTIGTVQYFIASNGSTTMYGGVTSAPLNSYYDATLSDCQIVTDTDGIIFTCNGGGMAFGHGLVFNSQISAADQPDAFYAFGTWGNSGSAWLSSGGWAMRINGTWTTPVATYGGTQAVLHPEIAAMLHATKTALTPLILCATYDGQNYMMFGFKHLMHHDYNSVLSRDFLFLDGETEVARTTGIASIVSGGNLVVLTPGAVLSFP